MRIEALAYTFDTRGASREEISEKPCCKTPTIANRRSTVNTLLRMIRVRVRVRVMVILFVEATTGVLHPHVFGAAR